MYFGIFYQRAHQKINQRGEYAGQNRTDDPGADDFGNNAQVGRSAAVKVPADNGADDCLRG